MPTGAIRAPICSTTAQLADPQRVDGQLDGLHPGPGRPAGPAASRTRSANTTIRSRTSTARKASRCCAPTARLQGWDGVFEYTYNHRPNFEPQHNRYFFSMIARTDVLAHFPACAAMFLRGDVAEAKTGRRRDRLPDLLRSPGRLQGGRREHRLGRIRRAADALLHKTAVDLSGKQGTDPASVEGIPPIRRCSSATRAS